MKGKQRSREELEKWIEDPAISNCKFLTRKAKCFPGLMSNRIQGTDRIQSRTHCNDLTMTKCVEPWSKSLTPTWSLWNGLQLFFSAVKVNVSTSFYVRITRMQERNSPALYTDTSDSRLADTSLHVQVEADLYDLFEKKMSQLPENLFHKCSWLPFWTSPRFLSKGTASNFFIMTNILWYTV